jgi:hypothetical protein
MKAKYAIRALMALARSAEKMLAIKVIAREADVPQKFLEAILLELKHNGIVDSKRGVFGGYYLAKVPQDITIGTLIRVLDGPLAPTRCASSNSYQKCDDCADEKTCEIRKVMLVVRNAISDVLDRKTLEDMAFGRIEIEYLI